MVNVEELRGRPEAEETVRQAARLYREKIERNDSQLEGL